MSLLVQDIVKMAEKQLVAAGVDNPKGDAEAMYCSLMRVDRSKFFMEWGEFHSCDFYFFLNTIISSSALKHQIQYIILEHHSHNFFINIGIHYICISMYFYLVNKLD